MDPTLIAILAFAAFLALLFIGVPVVYAFFGVTIGAMVALVGWNSLVQMPRTMYRSISLFVLLPVTLFILMGEILLSGKVATNLMDTLDMWLGRLPGRLALLAIGSGALMASLSGASIGTTAMLGSSLAPEMRERGYTTSMSLGPILGSGGLAIMLPPSALGVVLAVVAEVSVGDVLIAIIVPGICLAIGYGTYVLIRCSIDPSIAPPYTRPSPPLNVRVAATAKYVLPLSSILFLVIGTIFIGVATPTEAAALGCVGALALSAAYGGMSLSSLKQALLGTTRVSVMVLIILSGAEAFSQALALTGAHRAVGEWVGGLPFPPIVLIAVMALATILLGMFIAGVPLILISIPIFLPIAVELGFDPLWFGVILLLCVEVAQTTPPFGILLYIVKGVSPPDVTMSAIVRSAFPFVVLDTAVLVLMLLVPATVLYLPSLGS